MIHLCNAANGMFMIVLVNDNNDEVLSPTELFTRKETAVENLVSQLKEFGSDQTEFQDDTLDTQKVFCLLVSGSYYASPLSSVAKYTPKQ